MSPVRQAIPLWGMRYNFPQPSCPARVKANASYHAPGGNYARTYYTPPTPFYPMRGMKLNEEDITGT